MEEILSSLQWIADSLESIGRDMRKEEQVYKSEMEDRLSKGLTGEEAVRHYKEWMSAAGLLPLDGRAKK